MPKLEMSSSNEELEILGIDISKAKFDVALLKNNSKDKIRYWTSKETDKKAGVINELSLPCCPTNLRK
jgi:hypothetical protein